MTELQIKQGCLKTIFVKTDKNIFLLVIGKKYPSQSKFHIQNLFLYQLQTQSFLMETPRLLMIPKNNAQQITQSSMLTHNPIKQYNLTHNNFQIKFLHPHIFILHPNHFQFLIALIKHKHQYTHYNKFISRPMSRFTYNTPEKNTLSYFRQINNKRQLTPPTVEPKNATYSSIHRSKNYGDDNANIDVEYRRISYDNPTTSKLRTETIRQTYEDPSKYAINLPSPSSRVHHARDNQYFKMNETQLRQILVNYEWQIAALKDYIHQSQILERRRIIDIFGFSYRNYMHKDGEPCDCHFQSEQSKKMIKQLSSKVSSLLKQNQRLHSREKQIQLRSQKVQRIKTSVDDERLLRENEKLRKIIEEYEANDQQNNLKLRSKIFELNNHIRDLQQQNRQLIVSQRNTEPVIIKEVIKEPNTSKQDIEFAKSQLTKNIYEFSQNLEDRNKALADKVNHQDRRINDLSQQVDQYKKQRELKIESTIRKSYILSQSLKRPSGDQDRQIVERDEEMERDVVQSYYKPHFGKVGASNPIDTEKFENQKKQLQQKISMLEMRIKHLQDRIRERQGHIQDLQRINNDKVTQILILEKELQRSRNANTKIEVNPQLERQLHRLKMENEDLRRRLAEPSELHIKYIERERYDPEIQNQIRQIREILTSCNPNNYQIFFKEFNQIIEQRDLMNSKIAEYQSASSHLLQSKRQRANTDALNNKINQLTEQNKLLLNKVTELQEELEKYHSQIINGEFKKLTNIELMNPEVGPSGKQALQWQRIVKSCIDNSVVRLSAIEGRLSKRQGSKISRREQVIVHQRNPQTSKKQKITISNK